MITKKDYLLISIIGFFFGLLLLPVLNNIKFSFLAVNFINSIAIILFFAVFANIALFAASIAAKRIKIIFELAKFAAIGGLNTLLDLGVLNILILLSGVAIGYWYSLFKAISFVVANINSYFWNKHWTFGASEGVSVREFGEFFVVSLIGFGINVGVASLMVNIFDAPQNISAARWANMGALFATVASLAWNFVGYKFLVFKKRA